MLLLRADSYVSINHVLNFRCFAKLSPLSHTCVAIAVVRVPVMLCVAIARKRTSRSRNSNCWKNLMLF